MSILNNKFLRLIVMQSILVLCFIFFLREVSGVISFIGDKNPGFSFLPLPKLVIDPLGQKLYIASQEPTHEKAGQFSVSVFDVGHNQDSNTKVFLPLITKNALVNNVLEANPLFGGNFSHLSLLMTTTLEPKFYPVVALKDTAQIFLLNKLNIFDGEKNRIIGTDTLTDSAGNTGTINNLTTISHAILATVAQAGKTILDPEHNILFYKFPVLERIVPVPQTREYLTLISFEQPTLIPFHTCLSALAYQNPLNTLSFVSPQIITYGNKDIGTFYFGCSIQGTAGAAAISLLDQPIIEDFSLVAGNQIVMTDKPDTSLFIHNINSLMTSTGLSYLLIHGGQYTIFDSINSVFALPVINDPLYKVGTLANINQRPLCIFSENPPYVYQKTVLRESPVTTNDIYSTENTERIHEAVVGGRKLEYSDGTTIFKLQITDIAGYKDTVFVSTIYPNNDQKGIGGIFYSQALLDETGMIKNWTPWQRKNIIGNLLTAQYIPTLGSSVGLFLGLPSQPILAGLSNNGPFLNSGHPFWKNLPLATSGIEISVDIPWIHPAIGINKNPPFLKPSYMIHLGYNTVVLQQTARNNSLLPLYGTKTLICEDGTSQNIENKTNESILVFTGGALGSAGSLTTATLGYNRTIGDSWLLVGGSNGLYILSNNNGTGLGSQSLQDNFTGIEATLTWKKIGTYKDIKKIVSLDGFLFILTKEYLWRLPLNYENIMNPKAENLATVYHFPRATNYSSFADVLVSEGACLLASSIGLFKNDTLFPINQGNFIAWKEIELPESNEATPIAFSVASKAGYEEGWATGDSTAVVSNILVTVSSLKKHYTKIYRLISYGMSLEYDAENIKLLPNFFLKNYSTYFYNPGLELLSFKSDGATHLGHGIVGSTTLFRSFVSILSPFLTQGPMKLKNEFNFFEFSSKINAFVGAPTYCSGNGFWIISTEHGVQGLC